MLSRELNVRLRPEGRLLRLIDLRTGEASPNQARGESRSTKRDTRLWEAQAAEREAQIAEREAQIAERNAEVARLTALLRKAGVDPDAQK